jgi:hypothetical protein
VKRQHAIDGLEPRPGQGLQGLELQLRDPEPTPIPLALGNQLGEGRQPPRVDDGHPLEVEDDPPPRADARGQLAKHPVGGGEEQRAIDPEHRPALRHRAPPQAAAVGDLRDPGHLRHLPHEQHRGEEYAGGDGDHHIQQHGEGKTGGKHPQIPPGGGPEQMQGLRRLAHVPGHHQQQRRHGRHWQVGQQRRQGHQPQQHHQGVDHGRHRRLGAGLEVRGGTGDGGGGGDTAKKGRDDVADALPQQLTVGAVALAGHAVEHHGAEQRLDGAEHGDGEGRRQQIPEQLPAETELAAVRPRLAPGPLEMGCEGRNAAPQGTIRQ